MQQIIDTHIHVWDFEKAKYDWLEGNASLLNRSFALDELEQDRKKVGITEGVLVQAANNFDDTNWMLEVAEKTPWIKAVVGWLPLTNPDATAKAIECYQKNNYFKGVRHLIHDEADPKWLLQENVIQSLKLVAAHHLTYDVVGVLTDHIETVLMVSEKVPELKIVFDHLNQPPIRTNEKFGKWGELIKEAAARPQFFAKISGLGTTTGKEQWSADDVKPYVQFAIEHFGEDRCFCGGDWPVSLLAGSYVQTWESYKEVFASLLTNDQQEKVFYSNAKKFYRF
jgi:L-fuconolactonase